MNKEYLHLTPDAFIWNKGQKGFLYNSASGNGFSFLAKNMLSNTIANLIALENLYCVEIKHEIKSDPTVKSFISNVKRFKAGKDIQIPSEHPKPVILPPLLNLQSDVERLKKESPEMAGENVLDYLHELSIHINSLNASIKTLSKLDFNRLSSFLKTTLYSGLGQIHILASDFDAYTDSMPLLDVLDKTHVKKSLHLSPEQVIKSSVLLDLFSSNQFCLTIKSDQRINDNTFHEIVDLLHNNSINYNWTFNVANSEEYERVETLIEKHNLQQTEIKPIYNGDNLQFFEDHIYLTEEDLQSPGLSKREVFAHQALNTNDFGKLTITADGKVYANSYFPALGTIDDDIRELVYNEMDKGTSWRRIRDMKPCCDCVYQWLCPSPSNYELAIGKPNLCHVKL